MQYTPSVAHLGDLPGALESHRKAAALREALVASDPSNLDYRRELLDSHWFIATLLGAQGDVQRELAMIREPVAAAGNNWLRRQKTELTSIPCARTPTLAAVRCRWAT